MLILAGVSINAIVGDDGIISKATDAVYLNSCAYLEEYFNQLYATCAIDGNIDGETPLDTIMKNGYQNYFFSTSEGYCLKKNYNNSETGETQTLVLYLVKKEQLPEEVRNQIKGADNLESRYYRKLKGVYGITSDLKAYYCEDGIDSIMGLTTSDLNADSPDVIAFDKNSSLAQAVNGGNLDITNQGLKTISNLIIDLPSKVDAIKVLDKCTNLKSITIKDLNNISIEGIEKASKLQIVNIQNSSINDYSYIGDCLNLTALYMINQTQSEAAKFITEMSNAELNNLNYLGIYGTSTDYRYVTDISGLANWKPVTKEAVKYMYLYNENISSVACLSGFTNIYRLDIYANGNNLTSLAGIGNIKELTYLYAYKSNGILSIDNFVEGSKLYHVEIYNTGLRTFKGLENCNSIYKIIAYGCNIGYGEQTSAANADIDGLSALSNKTALYYLDIKNSSNLVWVKYLENDTALRELYLAGCSKIIDITSIASRIAACGTNYSVASNQTLSIMDNSAVLDFTNQQLLVSDFERLMNSTVLTHLSLQSITLKNDSGNLSATEVNTEINKVLKTCKNLKYLRLYGISALTSLDFVEGTPNLIELDIRNTSVTDYSKLENQKNAGKLNSLRTLAVNNASATLATIPKVISALHSDNYNSYWCYVFNCWSGGLICNNATLMKTLSECDTNLTQLHIGNGTGGDGSTIDLTGTGIKNFRSYATSYTFKLPSSVTAIGNWGGYYPIFAVGTKLDSIWVQNGSETGLEAMYKSAANCEYITTWNINWSASDQNHFKYIHYLEGSGVKNIHIGMGSGQMCDCSNLVIPSTCEKIWTNYTSSLSSGLLLNMPDSIVSPNGSALKYIKWEYAGLNNLNFVKEMPNLETIIVNNNYISSLEPLKNLQKLNYLNVNSNSIVDIYPLKNLPNLTSLYIESNNLTDFSYYTDENGKSVGYEVLDVLYDMNFKVQGKLEALYINNNYFDDTEIMVDLSWPKGKSGF